MSPEGGPAFWSAGGEVTGCGGQVLEPARAQALAVFYAGLAARHQDPRARVYLERRRAELDRALEQARRWRRAAGPLTRPRPSPGTAPGAAG